MISTLAIVLIVVGVIILFIILLYNSLIRLRNQVKNSFAQIDVQLKRRNDLIPNLVEAVKGYMKHEKSVFENVTKARSALLKADTVTEKSKASNQLTNTLKSLFAVAEGYPQLKANENFLELQRELSAIEDKVAYARQFYNDSILDYNNAVRSFPGNIFASIYNRKEKQFLEIPEESRAVPKVSF